MAGPDPCVQMGAWKTDRQTITWRQSQLHKKQPRQATSYHEQTQTNMCLVVFSLFEGVVHFEVVQDR